MSKSNLSDGAARMGKVVRAVRERQRSLSGLEDFPVSSMSPSDAWARKYMSESFGPELPKLLDQAPAPETPSMTRQAQFMRELRTKAGEPKQVYEGALGRMAMERPFVPSSQRAGWRGLRGK